MNRGFYREFEERHYAPRENILQMRKQYLPFLEALAEKHAKAPILDIGCGRGEWLELMNGIGFSARGIDLDEGMLQDCRDNNLNAIQGEGVAHLKELPANSQALITAFHVVEHIEFSQLQELIRHAKRALIPGGMLILETPNPENLVVGTSNFYLDPTHVRPIPHQLLSFLVEYEGFATVETLRLQEDKALKGSRSPTLYEVLSGASPDYAIIATKEGTGASRRDTSQTTSEEYGLSLRAIADQFDKNLEKKLELQREEQESFYTSLQHQLQYQLKNLRVQFADLLEMYEQQREFLSLSGEVIKTKSRLEFVENQNGLTFAHIMQTLAHNQHEILDLSAKNEQLTKNLKDTESAIQAMNLSPFWLVRTTIKWIKFRIKNILP